MTIFYRFYCENQCKLWYERGILTLFHINKHLPVLLLLPIWYSSSICMSGKYYICSGIPIIEQSMCLFKSCIYVTFVAYPWGSVGRCWMPYNRLDCSSPSFWESSVQKFMELNPSMAVLHLIGIWRVHLLA
jgi:hypothetical protein